MTVNNTIKDNSLVRVIGLINFESTTPKREDTVIRRSAPGMISKETLLNRVKKLEQSDRFELMEALDHLTSLLSTKVDDGKEIPTINLRERGLGLLLLGADDNSIPEQGIFMQVTNIFRGSISSNSLVQKMAKVKADLDKIGDLKSPDTSIIESLEAKLKTLEEDAAKKDESKSIIELKNKLQKWLAKLAPIPSNGNRELLLIWDKIEEFLGKIKQIGSQADLELIENIESFINRASLIESLEEVIRCFKVPLNSSANETEKRLPIARACRKIKEVLQRLDQSLKSVDQRKAEKQREIDVIKNRLDKFRSNLGEKKRKAAFEDTKNFEIITDYLSSLSDVAKKGSCGQLQRVVKNGLSTMVRNSNDISQKNKNEFLEELKKIRKVLKHGVDPISDIDLEYIQEHNQQLYAAWTDFNNSVAPYLRIAEKDRLVVASMYIDYLMMVYTAKKAAAESVVQKVTNPVLLQQQPPTGKTSPAAPQQTMPQTSTPEPTPSYDVPYFVPVPEQQGTAPMQQQSAYAYIPYFAESYPQQPAYVPYPASAPEQYAAYPSPFAGYYSQPPMQQQPAYAYPPYFAPAPQQQFTAPMQQQPAYAYTPYFAGSYASPMPQVTAPVTPPPSYENTLFAARQQQLQALAGIRDRILSGAEVTAGELQDHPLYKTVDGSYTKALNSALRDMNVTSINELHPDAKKVCMRVCLVRALNDTLGISQ